MHTSRLARETAKVASTTVSDVECGFRRETRSFAASLRAFTSPDLRIKAEERPSEKRSSDSASVASKSSIVSGNGYDIEDLPFDSTPSRQRKRKKIGNASTAITSISTVTSSRASPRKPGIKNQGVANGLVKKGKRHPAKRILGADGEARIEPPLNWEETYSAVKEMRKERTAPVDTMGCETLAEEHISPRDKRFQTLIALMLSSQTKDTTNAIAMRRLQTELPTPGLSLENILAVEPERLNDLIYVVGFHNNKTRYIKAAARILRDQFDGDIPDTIEGLTSLPGVGPKMAYLCLSAAWGRTEGIGVDVHVHRITNLWGWHNTKSPEDTRKMLEAWLPRENWHEINHLLVGFGQTVCAPLGRRCGECLLSEKGLCPSAVVEKKSYAKRAKKEIVSDGIDWAGQEVVEDAVLKEEDVVAEDAIV